MQINKVVSPPAERNLFQNALSKCLYFGKAMYLFLSNNEQYPCEQRTKYSMRCIKSAVFAGMAVVCMLNLEIICWYSACTESAHFPVEALMEVFLHLCCELRDDFTLIYIPHIRKAPSNGIQGEDSEFVYHVFLSLCIAVNNLLSERSICAAEWKFSSQFEWERSGIVSLQGIAECEDRIRCCSA